MHPRFSTPAFNLKNNVPLNRLLTLWADGTSSRTLREEVNEA
jgi:hypothetical protein